ncbi:Ribosomal protein L21-like [Dillenia turbinata]|uniref:Large ribosomal subunit protein bL21m n=1 Tax=Dillenia turbinata TaxID=194707 RepID=A0AAN8VE48_9MAGN
MGGANRRWMNILIRRAQSLLLPSSKSQTLSQISRLSLLNSSQSELISSTTDQIRRNFTSSISFPRNFSTYHSRGSSSRRGGVVDANDGDEYDVDDDVVDEDECEEVSDDEDDDDNVVASDSGVKREYSVEEKAKEAAAIGYKVVGPVDRSERPFKPYEPVFAVVQIGSHQFKVSNGDCIYTERLKFCEVNDKLILNRVLLLGTANQTIIGRPTLPDAAVYAVVEEHALDAKVIIFKKKRRKNYRRTKGHRQELTRLRIIDIQGIEKPEKTTVGKAEKASVKKPQKASSKRPEKVPVAA